MILKSIDNSQGKGWLAGPWNSDISIPIGYANEGVDLLHFHREMFEVYLIAQGSSTAVVNQKLIPLKAGDMLIVEPGEVHTFTESSEDYLHFVIHTPFAKGDKVIVEYPAN